MTPWSAAGGIAAALGWLLRYDRSPDGDTGVTPRELETRDDWILFGPRRR
jgi:hypothetical protein